MTSAIQPDVQRPAVRVAPSTRVPTIDCDMHNYIASDKDLMKYLDPSWHSHLRDYGGRNHIPVSFAGAPYPRSNGGGKRHDTKPPSGLPVGADFDFFKSNHFELHGFSYGILNCLSKAGDQLNDGFDAALSTAMNDWLIDNWLDREPRLRASLLIPYENAANAVKEIYRAAKHPGFVQVFFRARTRDPLGDPKYWPIFEAAQDVGLPIALHFAGMSRNPISASGWGSYYIEDHTTMSQAFQAHVISMVYRGVFERFPRLKLVTIESGFAWMPPLMWRMDKMWKRMKSEIPHLERLPSDVLRAHVRMTTMPMEEPEKPLDLLKVVEHLGSDEMLMYASDYPHWDFDRPDRAFQVGVPDSLKKKVFFDNAFSTYNFDRGGS